LLAPSALSVRFSADDFIVDIYYSFKVSDGQL
jgi:hypothetical protein